MIIYRVTNLINNKIYIGQTKYSLKERKHGHYSKMKDNTYFHKALCKYNKNVFIWEIIDKADTIEELNKKEQYWIKYYDSFNKNKGYNLTMGGEGSIGYIPSEETRKKMRNRMLGNKYTLGFKVKEETKEKLRNINLNKKLSIDHKNKIGKSNRKYIYILNNNKEILKIDDLVAFCNKNNINYESIRNAFKLNKDQYLGWNISKEKIQKMENI